MDARRQKFVANILAGMSQADAARGAGYSKKTARQVASKLMRVREVREAVDAAVQKQVVKAELTAEFVVKHLMDIAEKGERDSDRVAALGLLGKKLKLFTDKLEVQGKMTFAELVLAAQRKREDAPT